MWKTDADIPKTQIILDLEWLGNSLMPHTTHITQIAAKCVSDTTPRGYFQEHVSPLASLKAKQNAVSGYDVARVPNDRDLPLVLRDFCHWLSQYSAGTVPIVLIAHNGIRYDAPVLHNAFMKCGMCAPPMLYVMDSLHHVRYHLRCQKTLESYSLDSLAKYFNINVNPDKRHQAVEDVDLLHHVLIKTQEQCSCPFVTGMPVLLPLTSCMVVRGIGPVVCEAFDNVDLRTMCLRILETHPDLSQESCLSYFESIGLKERVPLVNAPMIARSIAGAAKRYLQYID